MKKYIGLVFFVFLISCKSKAVLVASKDAKEKLSADKIVSSHYDNKKDFSTLYIKSSVHYQDSSQTQNVTTEIKIKKDEIILVSIRFLGITMAKAMITPTEVKYYEKINGKYFEGDYAILSRWLGTDLDFNKVQNLFLGQALDDLKKGKFMASIEDKWYKLEEISEANTSKSFYFESDKFLIKKEQISQTDPERSVQIVYPNFTNYNQIALPSQISIEALQKKGKTTIGIEYNTVSFNEELSFPYSVPEGFERIFIN